MESLLDPLLNLFERERGANRPVALGVVVSTLGSTYRKAGALMLIASNGDYAGLLSGGCLESDLREHVRAVLETGKPRLIEYDTRGGDDVIWGLGLGCEGAITVALLRVGPERHWQPLTHLVGCLAQHRRTAVGIVTESDQAGWPVGTVILPEEASTSADWSEGPERVAVVAPLLNSVAASGHPGWLESSEAAPSFRVFAFPLVLPPRLLLLGAGPDAYPVVDFAVRLGWKVTVADHRAAYADASHFPAAQSVVLTRPEELGTRIELSGYAAAVVMSHHLPSDLSYLRVLSSADIPYIGLLGPATRRERLLSELGSDAVKLRGRLRSPVGLPIGGRAPESVALSIVSEIHAFLHEEEIGTPVSRDPLPDAGDSRPVPA